MARIGDAKENLWDLLSLASGRVTKSLLRLREPLGLSVTAGTKVLSVTRQALNHIVNGRSGISPEMAIRLTKAFGSTEETWLRMQMAYDLAAARKNESKIKVRRQHVPQELQVQ